ncbi:hypothetical protein ALI144C_20400 [Actinosynnema sp. ALI-1.44]|nr:hypothetical protein ALI144C_20400 [Actinosynnema sp. ALI-1.44]
MEVAVRATTLDHGVSNVEDVERAMQFCGDTLGLAGDRVTRWRLPVSRSDARDVARSTPLTGPGTGAVELRQGPRDAER